MDNSDVFDVFGRCLGFSISIVFPLLYNMAISLGLVDPKNVDIAVEIPLLSCVRTEIYVFEAAISNLPLAVTYLHICLSSEYKKGNVRSRKYWCSRRKFAPNLCRKIYYMLYAVHILTLLLLVLSRYLVCTRLVLFSSSGIDL